MNADSDPQHWIIHTGLAFQEAQVAESEQLLLTQDGYALNPKDDLSQFLGKQRSTSRTNVKKKLKSDDNSCTCFRGEGEMFRTVWMIVTPCFS